MLDVGFSLTMRFQFTHPAYLLLLIPALAWVFWFAWKSDVQVSHWRRWMALALRMIVLTVLVLAIAGLQSLSLIHRLGIAHAVAYHSRLMIMR